ncbi:MAG: deoxyribodipyrimidine photo-lyase [Candidatus Didemnitutus sp.]|nr:deoxyribodipyrimidine photo-lyase [Candidatus Didemnitutus sp.]
MLGTVVWFRQDLRLADNAALDAAGARGAPIVPVYILDDAAEQRWAAGGASRWWLHRSLAALDIDLRARGLRLILRRGGSGAELRAVLHATGANAVYWNRRYEPAARERDAALQPQLVADGFEAKSFASSLLFEPEAVRNKAGSPFQVFTPFWRHCLNLPVEPPVALAARCWTAPTRWPDSLPLAALGLEPRPRWDAGLVAAWTPGEKTATARLREFVGDAMARYTDERNLPAVDGTSALSPHLHFGEIGPRQIWAAVRALSAESGVFPASRGAQVFLSEVGWREFAHHLLTHFPEMPTAPLRAEFATFPWREDAAHLRAWQRGETGYPIVDAGMRQLWQTGWMHNRVRMIVGSFLVKHLRLSWHHGAAWFWDTLVDADLANNTMGWQWIAGCGADAAPYFRIFNPLLQGAKFDPEGNYVRRWVPELARLPAKQIHAPWEADAATLAAAGVRLGQDYPKPIVDHGEARAAALAAWQSMRQR